MSTRETLLIVEDSLETAGDVRHWLADDYDIHHALAAEDGEGLARDVEPSVILLDLQIPSTPHGADESTEHGLALLDRLVALDPFRPIVVFTAHSRDRELMRAVLQRTRGGQFVFKDDPDLEQALRTAIGVALGSTAWQMARTVRAFRALVDADHPEDTYRKYIRDHWRVLLGPSYRDCHSPYEFARGAHIDLLAIRHDGFADLWELKRPSDALFTPYNRWRHHSPACSRALGQLMEYIRLAEREYQPRGHGYDDHRGVDVDLNRPRGFVVIGRYQDEAHRERLRLDNSFHAGLRILTYDDLIEQAEQLVAFVRDARNGHGLERTP